MTSNIEYLKNFNFIGKESIQKEIIWNTIIWNTIIWNEYRSYSKNENQFKNRARIRR